MNLFKSYHYTRLHRWEKDRLGRFIKAVIVFMICFLAGSKIYSQNIYVANAKEINLRSNASAGSRVIGEVHYGDTIVANFNKGDWLNISLKNGLRGFIPAKYATQILGIVQTGKISETPFADLSVWNFSSLLSATFSNFLLLTALILLVLLLIYYLK
ncbi:MAG: SH3 domain-containing protein [Bacteroidota bacterium]|nr:SH3 domain-containing protein [Bacteroidota bacterium]